VVNATGTRTFRGSNGQSSTANIVGTGQDAGDATIYTTQPYVLQDGGFTLVLDRLAVSSTGSSPYAAVNIINPTQTGPIQESTLGSSGVVLTITTATVTPNSNNAAVTSTSSSSNSLSGGAIAGIVIGVVVGLLLLCILLFVCLLYNSRYAGNKGVANTAAPGKSETSESIPAAQPHSTLEESVSNATRTQEGVELS